MSYVQIENPLVFQCPMCKSLTHLTSFSSSDEGIEITCTLCSEVFFVPSFRSPDNVTGGQNQVEKVKVKAKNVASSKRVEAKAKERLNEADSEKRQQGSKKKCPKCFALLREEAKDCPKCGLLLKNVGATFDPDQMMKAENPLEQRALELWSELLDDWNDEAKHQQFIQYCHTQKLLERAAFHYQKVKSEESELSPLAIKKLSLIVELVQQQFLLEQERRGSSSASVKRGKWVLAFGILVFAGIAFYVIWKTMAGGTMQMQIP